MTKYKYKLWCFTCLDDPLGCFEGQEPVSDATFDTYEEAEEAADEAAGNYEYTVFEVEEEENADLPSDAETQIGLD